MSGIYLAFTTNQHDDKRHDLFNTLLKANFQVYPSNLEYDNGFFSHITEEINSASCSVHIFGLDYGSLLEGQSISLAHYQYNVALNKLKENSSYKIFVWFPYSINDIKDELQLKFISDIRNNITHGINFSNTSSAIQLVDDLRTSVKVESKQEFDIKDTDVFLVYNQLDDYDANDVAEMLSDIIPIEKLNIVQDSDMDYSEFCAQQIGKSKLAVIYFKESADWALPFTQQIWKKIGGASSHTPILLIGDEDPETNTNKKFKAPKVVSLIVAGELIPLEIKVQYDKIIEAIG
ncbi:MAG: hypothetical protein K9H41_00570 [Bacteroidia bacterium]|nr:hypothetical protein [Bacteroidia bacterium]